MDPKLNISRPGQKFVDRPVYRFVRAKPVSLLSSAMGEAQKPPIRMLDYVERTPLRWMEPMRNPDGSLVRGHDGNVKLRAK